ncbi:MAG: hypothetical protein KDA41_07510 [Planctomycetales bacterium]|nr:hypothetical protein [Planctomycetales bacterium]
MNELCNLDARSALKTTAALAAMLLPSAAPAAAGEYRGVMINMMPHVCARPDFTGEACAAMVLKRRGSLLDQDFVFEQSGVDPAQGRGCNTAELKLALDRIGFVVGQVWHRISPDRARHDVQQQFDAMYADLSDGVPSIVPMKREDKRDAPRQFRLVLGYDPDTDEVIYHEPTEADGAFRRMGREAMFRLWPERVGTQWTVARMPLRSDDLNFVGPAGARTLADYAQHVRALKPRLPQGFHVFVQPPFVVIGNELEGTVRKHADGTVKWAVDRLKLMYFEKDPAPIINVWLFKDEASYNAIIKEVYQHEPSTKFGYYSPSHQAIFANMRYGSGTLVHEIVHPFMLANFPKCPSWFNEGLASLYEQSNDRDGLMVAQTNTRLRELQRAILDKKMTPIQTLTSTTREDFYNSDERLMNYASARFLLYYLEKKNLLTKYYHEFRDNVDKDPTGYDTLQRVLGDDARDMAQFQRKWEYWLLMRRF